MKLRYILNASAVLASIFFVAACDKTEEPSKRRPVAAAAAETPAEEDSAQNHAAVVVEDEVDEVVEPAAPAVVEDKHFLLVDFNAENAKAEELLEAELEISVPFKNPYDEKDIHVYAFINGGRNGVSINWPLYYVSGDGEKSVWRMKFLPQKSGEYKCVFNINSNGRIYFSNERSFSVGNGGASKIYGLGRRAPSHFSNPAGSTIRAVGGSIPFNLGIAGQKDLLQQLKSAGGNTARLSIEAPLALFVSEDSANGNSKAGWLNASTINKIEEFMDAAAKQGIYTVLDFASPRSFAPEIYAQSYFAKSGIAKTPAEFFSSFEAQRTYNRAISYIVSRFAARADLLMWQPFARIDAFDDANLDSRVNWLSGMVAHLRDIDIYGHPIMLSSGTSSDVDYIWSDNCDLLAFELSDSNDYAVSVDSHVRYFRPRLRKSVGVLSIDNELGAFGYEDPSFVRIHNSVWASLFTNSPILVMLDLGHAEALPAAFDAIKSAAAFEKTFGLAAMDIIQNAPMPDIIIQPAPRAQGNSIIAQPAFGRTLLSRETSNDLGVLIFAEDGSIARNTLPSVWVNGAIIRIKIENVPNDKCVFSFDAVSMPQDCKFDMTVELNGENVLNEHFDGQSVKAVREERGVNKAYLNKNIRIPLGAGDQTILIEFASASAASLDVANMRVEGMGSNNGVFNVSAYSISDKNASKKFIWFKRGGTDDYSFARYKLYEKGLLEQRSFDYVLPVSKADASYKVTWFDTRTGEIIASGTVKSNAESALALKTPNFKNDVACAVEEL